MPWTGWQTALTATGAAVGLAAVAWPALVWFEVRRLEKPRYELLKVLANGKRLWSGEHVCELRRYHPYLVAEVSVEPPTETQVVDDARSGMMSQAFIPKDKFRTAISGGFRQVAGYIFGKNTTLPSDTTTEASGAGAAKTTIAMTSPVRVEMPPAGSSGSSNSSGESIAMTSPVRTEMPASGGDGAYKVSFMMPSKYSMPTDLPRPLNPNVKLREVPPASYAVLSFKGNLPDETTVQAREQELRSILNAEGVEVEGPVLLYQYYPPFAPGFIRLNEVQLLLKQQ